MLIATDFWTIQLNPDGSLWAQINDTWGTICDDSWTLDDADVACQQLGYSDGAISAYYLPGDGRIQLQQVECSGQETALHYCNVVKAEQSPTLCNHGKDVAVECQGS